MIIVKKRVKYAIFTNVKFENYKYYVNTLYL